MRNKPLRILLAGANPYNANKGVAALAISTIRLLNEVAEEIHQNIEICVYTHESSRTYDIIHLPEGDVKIQNVFPSDIFGLRKIVATLTSRWKLYNLIQLYKCDYMLNLTAGDSFSDIYGFNNFNSVNKINRIASVLRIPYSFLPQTYGPFFDPYVKKAALRTLTKADMLLSRDELSTRLLREELPEREIKSLVDVAFYLPYNKQNNHVLPGINVGINISQTLWDTPADNKISLSCSYRETVYVVIKKLIDEGCVVHIIPHVVNSDNHEDNEYYLSYRIWEKINNPNVKLAPLFLSPVDAKSYISALDLFIGARMHACIAAFSSGVPVLPLSYSRKFEGLFKSTLGYNYVINLTKINSIREVERMIDEMLLNRNEIRKDIEHINETVVANLLSGIKDSLRFIIVGANNNN